MGAKLVKECYEHWGHLAPMPFRVLVGMAVTAYDESSQGKPARLYFAGIDETVRLSGGTRRGALKALATLRDAGAIEYVVRGAPGRNATFRLLSPAASATIGTGEPQGTRTGEPQGTRTGEPEDTDRCTTGDETGEPEGTPRNNRGTREEGHGPAPRYPEQCGAHQTGPHHDACPACGRARRDHATALEEARARRARERRAEQLERSRAAGAAIAECTMCDRDGRTPGGAVCHHVESVGASEEQWAAIRAAVGASRRPA